MTAATTSHPQVTERELAERIIRRSDLVSCNQAFIDCRTPGSDLKENYALIGPGVTQNPDQVVNLRTPHGYNIGGAAMPNGVTNSLHLHFTAEVFLVTRGEYTFRWGVDGSEGELVGRAGDVISVPTWIFRGFTNTGPDDNFLFTALGEDDTGGILWGPTVLDEAAKHGLYLRADNTLLDVEAGETLDESTELVTPMAEKYLAELEQWSVADMASRVVRPDERDYRDTALICCAVPGGRAELAPLIGFGLTEHRRQAPPMYNPHGFSIAALRAEPGQGMLMHAIDETQVLLVESGEWTVTLNELDQVSVTLDPEDTLSIPRGAWRTFVNTGPATATAFLITGGDARARITWSDEVLKAARDQDVAHDANGYIAPWTVVRSSVLDD